MDYHIKCTPVSKILQNRSVVGNLYMSDVGHFDIRRWYKSEGGSGVFTLESTIRSTNLKMNININVKRF